MNVSKPFIHESTNRSTDEHRSLGHARPWRVVAEEVSREQDPARLTKLVEELNQALDEQGIGKSQSKTH
jgi:hypothetical protein